MRGVLEKEDSMGSTRFRKSKKIAPGVKLNVTKTGVGISVGGKYGGVSVNSKGDVTKRVSAPGTGVSYVEREGKSKRAAKEAEKALARAAKEEEKAAKKEAKKRERSAKVSALKDAVIGEKKCAVCGTKLSQTDKFCGNCGSPTNSR